MQVRQLERDSAHFPKIIVGIFLAIAVITLGIAAISTFNTTAALSKEESTLYDPEQPSRSARIQSVGSSLLMWIVPIITGIVGAVFLAAALFVARFFRPNATEARSE